MKTGPRPQEWHHWRQVCGGGFEPAPTDYRHLLARLSAVRDPWSPGPVELPGVDAPFVWARIPASRPRNRGCDDEGGCPSPESTVPSSASSQSDPRRERRPFQGDGRQLPAAPRCNLTRGRRARRGNGIGNASCGCPVCTVLGGATYSVVKVLLRLVGADARGSVTISAASIRRASSAGAPIRGDVPRVPRHCPFG